LEQDGVIQVAAGRLNTSEVLTADAHGVSLNASIANMAVGDGNMRHSDNPLEIKLKRFCAK